MADEDLGFVPDQEDDGLGFVPEQNPYKQAGMDALQAGAKTFTAPWDLANTLSEDPAKMQEVAGPWLPTAGAAIGTAIAPGPGTAIGAGLGEIARQAGDIAFGLPDAIPAGQNFSPRAGLNAAAQTAFGGMDRVSGIFKVAPGAKPYVTRGIEAVGEKLAPVGNAIKRGVARAAEVMTGTPSRYGVKLIEEPGRLVAGIGKGKKLGQAVGDAEEALASRLENAPSAEPLDEAVNNYGKKMFGFEGDVGRSAGLKWGPELDAAITTNKGGIADDIVTDLLVKAKKTPGAITVDEAMAGVKSIDKTFPNYTAKNGKIIQKYTDLRSTLSEILDKADPKLANAKAAAHDAYVGGAFRHPFRQTKTGQTSAVPFLSFLFSPSNWGGEQLAGQALKLPAFSPAVWGTGMAAGSAAVKTAGAVASSPTARQALISRYITKRDLDQSHQ